MECFFALIDRWWQKTESTATDRRKPSGEAKFKEEISSRRASNVFNHQNYGLFTATQLVSKGPR